MKKLITMMAIVFIIAGLSAQAPEKMSYQAVVRDGLNKLITNHAVGMRISIIRTSATGSVVFRETHTPTSNLNGLVSIEIGMGTPITGTFSSIDWSNGPYFIKTEIDPAGGTIYSITATTQLLSVPYALYANDVKNKQWTETGTSMYFNTGKVGIGVIPGSADPRQLQVFATDANAIYAKNNSTSYSTIYSYNDGTGAAANFTNNSTGYTLYAQNFGTGPAAFFDGSLQVSGGNNSEINRSQSGTANIVPICYGSVSSTGVKNLTGSTSNFTVSRLSAGIYEITITGETYSQSTHCAITSLGDPGFINSIGFGGKLRVYTYSHILNSSNVLVYGDKEFSFVVYKP